MNWGRAKTILIILFLMADAFLLIVMLRTHFNTTRLSADVITQTIEVLQKNHIQVEVKQIPKQRIKNQSVIIENFFCRPAEAAQSILGQNLSLVSENPSQYAYTYESDRGTLTIQRSNFSYVSRKQAKPYDTGNVPRDEKLREVILNRLNQLGFRRNRVQIGELTVEQGIVHCKAIPCYENKQIYGVSMYITADSENILSLDGNWFEVVSRELHDEELLDVTSVLVEFMYHRQDHAIRIDEISHGYYVSEEYLNSQDFTAAPVYIIRESSGTISFFDASTGAVIE